MPAVRRSSFGSMARRFISSDGDGGLSGFPNGNVIRYGGLTARCGIEVIDNAGNEFCSGAIEPTHLSAVNEKLAYAGYGSCRARVQRHRLATVGWNISASVGYLRWRKFGWGTKTASSSCTPAAPGPVRGRLKLANAPGFGISGRARRVSCPSAGCEPRTDHGSCSRGHVGDIAA